MNYRIKFVRKPDRNLAQLGNLASVGITLVVATVVGLFMGLYLDKWLGTHPVFTILMLLFGIAAGFVNLFREAGSMGNKKAKKDGNGDREKNL